MRRGGQRHLSGTPALRMPTWKCSRVDIKLELSVATPTWKRRIMKVDSSASPASVAAPLSTCQDLLRRRQEGSERGPVSVALDRASQPANGLLVDAEVQFGGAYDQHLLKCEDVPRRKSERLFYMGLGFIGTAAENLAHAHQCVSISRRGLASKQTCSRSYRSASLLTVRSIGSGLFATSPTNRTSPVRHPSAIATACFFLAISKATKTSLYFSNAR